MIYLALQTPLWLVATLYAARMFEADRAGDRERVNWCLAVTVGCLVEVNVLTLVGLHR